MDLAHSLNSRARFAHRIMVRIGKHTIHGCYRLAPCGAFYSVDYCMKHGSQLYPISLDRRGASLTILAVLSRNWETATENASAASL
jgi:hypothetical protein